MPPSQEPKKKKRTLVVIDGEVLKEGAKYDFSFLEKEKRLELWFFYQSRVHHVFHLRRDYTSHTVVLPRYEEDLHLYLLKRVCYELGRREGRYRKVFLIGGHHPIWEGLVQFLRERELACQHILAEDYRLSEEKPPESFVLPSEERAPQKLSQEASASSMEAPAASAAPPPPRPKKTSRRLPKAEAIAVYERIAQALRMFPPGTQFSRAEFRNWLRKQGFPRKQLPGRNFGYVLKRLSKLGYLQVEKDIVTIQEKA